MIKDIFLSFNDNIKQKTTNPFFGTLIIVWILHNWKLIFTFFNFEKNKTLADKIDFLSNYLEAKPFLLNIGCCVLITIAVLIITYSLLNLSRLIVNTFDNKVTPRVYKMTDKNSIVLKSKYQTLENERDLLSQKLVTEREAKLRLQSEISQLEERIKELITKEDKKEPEAASLVKTDVTDDKVNLLFKDIENRNLTYAFDDLINNINNEEYINTGKAQVEINYFLKAGIIKLVDKHSRDDKFKRFIFTDLGEKIKEEFVMNSLSK